MSDFLTPDEFANAAGVRTTTVRTWLKDGRIEGKKFGLRWRISKEELKKVLPDDKKETE